MKDSASPLKIAITSLYLPSGSKIGVGHVVHHLANELTQRGHELTVFSQCGPSEGALYRTVQIPARARGATFGFAWDLRNVNFSGFDVLSAHGDDWFLWGKKRPRHVHTFHGSCASEMLHARSLRAKIRMAGLALCELSPVFLADVRTAVSSNTRRTIPRIEHIIPNGVDLQAFSPLPISQKSEAPSILFVGSLNGRKRGDLLLKAFREQVRSQIPDAQFWGVCDGPNGERDGREGEPGEIWFGRASFGTLRDLYRRAWVFCLPSSYEGFGVPYIEAMASGTPVVATPNAGAVEVTRNGRDGVLSSPEELGQTLVRLLQNEGEREAWRERGLQRAPDFSWERVCAQYLAVFRGEEMPQ